MRFANSCTSATPLDMHGMADHRRAPSDEEQPQPDEAPRPLHRRHIRVDRRAVGRHVACRDIERDGQAADDEVRNMPQPIVVANHLCASMVIESAGSMPASAGRASRSDRAAAPGGVDVIPEPVAPRVSPHAASGSIMPALVVPAVADDHHGNRAAPRDPPRSPRRARPRSCARSVGDRRNARPLRPMPAYARA